MSRSINVNASEKLEASLPPQLFGCAASVFIFRKQYRKVLDCVVIIQKNYRAFLLRRRFLHLKKAAVVFQKQLRGQIARKVYRHLLVEKRAEEEKRKREEEEKRRREEEERYGTFLAWVRQTRELIYKAETDSQILKANLTVTKGEHRGKG